MKYPTALCEPRAVALLRTVLQRLQAQLREEGYEPFIFSILMQPLASGGSEYILSFHNGARPADWAGHDRLDRHGYLKAELPIPEFISELEALKWVVRNLKQYVGSRKFITNKAELRDILVDKKTCWTKETAKWEIVAQE